MLPTNPVKQAQQTLIVDGKPARYVAGNPQFSADSKRLFTQRVAASATQTTEVLMDGQLFFRGRLLTLYIPPVGDLVVAVDEPGQNDRSGPPFLVVGGKKVEGTDGCPVNSTNRVVFSPDGRHYAAHCQRSPTINWVVVDGKKSLEYPRHRQAFLYAGLDEGCVPGRKRRQILHRGRGAGIGWVRYSRESSYRAGWQPRWRALAFARSGCAHHGRQDDQK